MIAEIPNPIAVTPTRGTQAQVAETLPPPPTTTTTTAPPAWALPNNSGSGRRVVYSKSRQRVWTVEADGTVSKTHLVSGRLTWNQPLPGTYSVFSRSAYTCNINNPSICWRYMVRFAKGPSGDNIGFHEIPTNLSTGNKLQSESQLGTPLSGGCVRQATNDAIYMWGWAPVGTTVVVLG
jgi:lipoprotein-anchoring transpeptidase ErfK/SrfK